MYFLFLDILRFIAATMVMCFHYFSSSLENNGIIQYIIKHGYLGVELFFIISGFVIYFSLRKSTKEYFLGRFLRLYPLFWVLCTITYIATHLFPNGEPLSFGRYLANLLIVNDGKTALMVDGSYWTLTIEIFFYAFIGVFAYLFGVLRLMWFYIAWLVFSFLVFYFNAYDIFITKILLARYVPYFVFGGVLGLLTERWKTTTVKEKSWYIGVMTAAAALPTYISIVLGRQTGPITNHFGMFEGVAEYALVSSFFVIMPLAVWLSFKVTKPAIIRFAMLCGGITYPLYLLHHKLGSLIIGMYGTFGYVTLLSVVVALGMIAISAVISIYEGRYRKNLYRKIKIRI